MTASTITPGPWYIDDGRIYCGAQSDLDYLICDIAPDTDNGEAQAVNEQDEANARLIAAAPELLEALEAMLAFAAAFGPDDAAEWDCCKRAAAVVAKARWRR